MQSLWQPCFWQDPILPNGLSLPKLNGFGSFFGINQWEPDLQEFFTGSIQVKRPFASVNPNLMIGRSPCKGNATRFLRKKPSTVSTVQFAPWVKTFNQKPCPLALFRSIFQMYCHAISAIRTLRVIPESTVSRLSQGIVIWGMKEFF